MKNVLFILFLSLSFLYNAQISLDSKIKDKIGKLETSLTAKEFDSLKDDFVLLTNEKKYGWVPAYYAAVSSYNEGYLWLKSKNTENIENSTLTALKYLSVFSDGKNVEAQILKGLIYALQVKSNSEVYSAKNIPLINDIIREAELKVKDNARLALLKAELISLMPENKGKSNVDLYYEVLKKYKSPVTKSNIDPTWGENLISNSILGK